MNIKSMIAATLTLSVFAAPALAGELYGSVERSAERSPSSLVFLKKLNTPLTVDGELHAQAQASLDNAVGSQAPRRAYVTTLAVGGELGSPIPSPSNLAGATALAE